MIKKWLKRILFLLTILIVISGIIFYLFYNRFVVEAPKKEFPVVVNTKEAQQQDLDYLSLYIDYDKSFDSDEKRAAFRQHIKALKSVLPLSKPEFEMVIAKIMAIANNTHTNIHPSLRARRLNAVPLRFYWFEEGLYVILAKLEYNNLLGKKILKINGYTPEELLSKLKPWYGGNQNRLKFFSPLYFMSPELLNAIGLGTSNSILNIEYLDFKGDIINQAISVTNDAKEGISYWPPYWLNISNQALKNNWQALITQDRIALPFQHIEKNVWHQFIKNGLYVKLNENVNTENLNISSYLDNILKNPGSKALDFAILDLRFNPGGDYNIARSFIKKIDRRLHKNRPFYIITGNGTFSAGIMTAAIAKHTLGDRVKIIGESVGDYLQFWADGGSIMKLPNSKISLRIWTAYHDWQNGCKDWNKCFWITIFDGVAVDNLNLDKFIPLKFSDYVNGKDSVTKTIL
ncbi:hypothetical protein GTQ40_02915 [Flavobacteriaceae bacterium R38]|nr:hypothetical protein [Flavobacteriaceae bacterium R38]